MKGPIENYKLALFRKVRKTKKSEAKMGLYSLMFCIEPSCEAGKPKAEEAPTPKKPQKYTLEFVCFCKTEADIANAVRKAPHDKYVLFRGQAIDVQVAMPVFAGGKNLNTFMAEWA